VVKNESQNLVKVLTPNDLGLTGGHQAGIHVPREAETVSFFPRLDETGVNPRVSIQFELGGFQTYLTLTFIHYNGKLFGTSTRNEYRLTGLTRYFRQNAAAVGDELELTLDTRDQYGLSLRRQGESSGEASSVNDDQIVLLSGTWKTIRRGRFA
jgi:hypothetical protein